MSFTAFLLLLTKYTLFDGFVKEDIGDPEGNNNGLGVQRHCS